jgi:hypothetical protein
MRMEKVHLDWNTQVMAGAGGKRLLLLWHNHQNADETDSPLRNQYDN